MKKYKKYLFAIVVGPLIFNVSVRAQNNDHDGCSNSTLKGDYAFTISGQIFNQNGTFTQVNGVAMTNFDGEADAQGKGGLTQVDFIVSNPPLPGPPPPTDPLTSFRTQESGTYQVFPDCTGKATINFPPLQHGLVIQLTFVLSNQGRKIHAVVSTLTAPTPGGPVTIPAAISAVAEKVGTIRRERE
jgi:hypothetical protein